MAQAVCAQGQMDCTNDTTPEVGWYFWASVYPVVKWVDKTHPNVQEDTHSKCLVLPRKSQAFSDDPFANASHPQAIYKAKMTVTSVDTTSYNSEEGNSMIKLL